MKLKGIELNGTYKAIYDTTSFEVYNEKDHLVYFEDSKGFWEKWEYDEKDHVVYYENSNDYWGKWVYNEKDHLVYYESSNNYWSKWEYNEKGILSYYENSKGNVFDERVKELTIEQIENLLGYKIKIKGERK